ncbi:hypothetical protein [Pseudonocardia sp. NPDC049154]|uniref:hypothetical protein n=1 Tax=Pseudonocardia sp. NPDC049154 TaxID=3155501 RepID=UPI0033F77720
MTGDDSVFVRALNVFYAGARVNNRAKGLWPHSSFLASPFELPSGKRLDDYPITDMVSRVTLRTFCHENGT